jgi:hypothetical protein
VVVNGGRPKIERKWNSKGTNRTQNVLRKGDVIYNRRIGSAPVYIYYLPHHAVRSVGVHIPVGGEAVARADKEEKA